MTSSEKLQYIKSLSNGHSLEGLAQHIVSQFIDSDQNLIDAIDSAYVEIKRLKDEYGELLEMPEEKQVEKIQESFVNFYDPYSVNPYVAVAAKGPWIITASGAVLHDSGGYGMLGFGHDPAAVVDTMSKSYVMANIMTASYSQLRFTNTLKQEIGHSRSGEHCNPYARFVCLNSGSESVTVASRISDLNTKNRLNENPSMKGKQVKFISLKGSFHGRTDRPSQVSDSCLNSYKKNLASFENFNKLDTVEPNHCEQLEALFKNAEANNVVYEAMFMEPVMGEGNPGMAITPEFYKLARELTSKHGCLLIIDSIQAGLRATGHLSITDYPGFRELSPPDMETFSKALNAGQYPLSVLALTEHTARIYKTGSYGNTMTTNPRALEVATTVLTQVTDSVRDNIVLRGKEFVEKLNRLGEEFSDIVKCVQGTGLLFSMELDKDHYKVTGELGVEAKLRTMGLGVIHGGENALRFTPHFNITSKEVDLIVELLRSYFISSR